MNNLIIIVLGFLKMGGMFTFGIIQLMLLCAAITLITRNKSWLRIEYDRLKNYMFKGTYN